jgi:hypothetical protein
MTSEQQIIKPIIKKEIRMKITHMYHAMMAGLKNNRDKKSPRQLVRLLIHPFIYSFIATLPSSNALTLISVVFGGTSSLTHSSIISADNGR